MDFKYFCLTCGKELPEDSRFCNFCGSSVSYKSESKNSRNSQIFMNNLNSVSDQKGNEKLENIVNATIDNSNNCTLQVHRTSCLDKEKVQINDEKKIPQFKSPDTDIEKVPKFKPPNSNQLTNLSQQGCCTYHKYNVAVVKCQNCGNPICEECKEVGELDEEGYVCFDCASLIVQNDIEIAKEKKGKVIFKIIIGIIGAIVFGIGSSTPKFADVFRNLEPDMLWKMKVLFTLWGAAIPVYFPILGKILFWRCKVIKQKLLSLYDIQSLSVVIYGIIKEICSWLFGFWMIFGMFMIVSPIVTIILGIVEFVQFRKAKQLIARNEEILQHLLDHMEYIRIKSEENMDNESLINDIRMQNNQFAQAVSWNGYEKASKSFADEIQEMAENDKKIKKYIRNEYGEAVRIS